MAVGALPAEDGPDATQLSPDGREIVFRSARMGEGRCLESNADGSDPQKLTLFDKGWPGTPRWLPDGMWIVFDSRLGEHSHITMVDSEGRNQHDVVAGDYENVVPSWSRDGSSYSVSNRTGKWQVWKRELATIEETQVTRNGGFLPSVVLFLYVLLSCNPVYSGVMKTSRLDCRCRRA